MAYLLSCERDQSYLMPPSMRDWLSEGHLAWFIVDAVGQMDLREFYAVYRSDGLGAAAYDPGMMVAILLYAKVWLSGDHAGGYSATSFVGKSGIPGLSLERVASLTSFRRSGSVG